MSAKFFPGLCVAAKYLSISEGNELNMFICEISWEFLLCYRNCMQSCVQIINVIIKQNLSNSAAGWQEIFHLQNCASWQNHKYLNSMVLSIQC